MSGHWSRLHIRKALTVLALCAAPIVALGHGTVDQEFLGPFDFGMDMNEPGGSAQGFTPVEDSLGAVDLFLVGSGTAPAVNLVVNIRAGSADGDIQGTAVVSLPEGLVGTEAAPAEVHVDFGGPVTLTPGSLYYVQVEPDGGHYGWAGALGNPYGDGGGYIGTFAIRGLDLGFRTYTYVEPQPVAPQTVGACTAGGWATFTTPRVFKSQGDCIRFVQTGK